MSTRRNRLHDMAARHRTDERVERAMERSAEIRLDALVDVLTDVAAMASSWPVEARIPGTGTTDTGDDPEASQSADGDRCPNCGHHLGGNGSRQIPSF